MPLRDIRNVKPMNRASLVIKLNSLSEVSLTYIHKPTGFVLKLDKYASITREKTQVERDTEFSSKETCTVPFHVALTSGQVFIYGKAARDYVLNSIDELLAKKIKHWRLGYLLLAKDVDEINCVVECNETAADVDLETLISMFLLHIIGIVEKMLSFEDGTSSVITKLVVIIPMWFPVQATHILQLAGNIVGVKMQFVNELTFEAWLRLQFAQKSRPGNKKKAARYIMAVSNNSGHVDLAVYKTIGTKLKMLACASTVFSAIGGCGFTLESKQVNNGGSIRKRYQATWWCKEKTGIAKEFITCLLDEVFQVLSSDDEANARRNLHLLVLADNSWVELFKDLTFEKVRSLKLLQSENFEDNDNELVKILDNLLSGKNATDLSPIQLYSRQGNNKDVPMELKANCVWTTRSRCCQRLTIFQKNCLEQEFVVGELTFSRLLPYKYSRVEVSVRMENSLGGFELQTVYGWDSKGEKTDITKLPDLTWTTRATKQEKRVSQRLDVLKSVTTFSEQYKAQLQLLTFKCKILLDQLSFDYLRGSCCCRCSKCQKSGTSNPSAHDNVDLVNEMKSIWTEVQKIKMYDKSVEFIETFTENFKSYGDTYSFYQYK